VRFFQRHARGAIERRAEAARRVRAELVALGIYGAATASDEEIERFILALNEGVRAMGASAQEFAARMERSLGSFKDLMSRSLDTQTEHPAP
jgi:hypothetical protein